MLRRMPIIYFILVILILWLGPYVLIVIAILIVIGILTNIKPVSNNEQAQESRIDESEKVPTSNAVEPYSTQYYFEISKQQSEKLQALSNAMRGSEEPKKYKIINRLLSFQIAYWQKEDVCKCDLYDYILKAANERINTAKRDFVKKECKIVLQIVKLLKEGLATEHIVQTVFPKEMVAIKNAIETVDITEYSFPIQSEKPLDNKTIEDLDNHPFQDKDHLLLKIHTDESEEQRQVVYQHSPVISQIISGLLDNAICRKDTVVDLEDEIFIEHDLLLDNVQTIIWEKTHIESAEKTISEESTITSYKPTKGGDNVCPTEGVPHWEHTYIYSAVDLQQANHIQKQFYRYFKAQFLKGYYLDIEDHSNYVFVLMFDLADDYKKHKDYELLKHQLDTLAKKYPVVAKYVNKTIVEAVIAANQEEAKYILQTVATILLLPNEIDIKDVPKIQVLITNIKQAMKQDSYMVKPIDWLFTLWGYERREEKSIYKEYADSIIGGLRRIGFGIVPDYEVDKKRFNFGDICVIYKNEDQQPVTLTKKYEQTKLFIKLACYIIHADKVLPADLVFIEQCIQSYHNTVGNNRHLIAFARWRLSFNNQPIDKQLKNSLTTLLTNKQRAAVGNNLIQIACINGDIRPKRIDRLKKILLLLELEMDNIHSQIHRILTDSDGFAVIEKKSNAIEFTISNQPSSRPQSNESRVIINQKKLRIFEQQTKAAQELLSNIFIDEDVTTSQNVTSEDTTSAWMDMLKLLLTKEMWSRAEVENECKKRRLMLGAVLEQINDYAYEKVDDTVIEDDGDNIYVTLDYKKQLI